MHSDSPPDDWHLSSDKKLSPFPEKKIHDVWDYNFHEEMIVMRDVWIKYPFVAFDTEFPGSLELFNTWEFEGEYSRLKNNVNVLRLVQLGFSFFNGRGEEADCKDGSTWQFNFKFDLKLDHGNKDSFTFLKNCGINFKKHEEEGIDQMMFAETMYSSGLLMNPKIRWITFHGSADCGYMLRLLSGNNLPVYEDEFFMELNTFFPKIYDTKIMTNSLPNLKGGLQTISEIVGASRDGKQHNAGSDSLLTGRVFFLVLKLYFQNTLYENIFMGQIHPLYNGVVHYTLPNFYGMSKELKPLKCNEEYVED